MEGWTHERTIDELRAERDKLLLQLSEAERKGRDLCQQNGELLMTLHEIARGAGPYSRDHLEHATNTIEAMKQLAKDAVAIPEMRVTEKPKCEDCAGTGEIGLADGEIWCPKCRPEFYALKCGCPGIDPRSHLTTCSKRTAGLDG